MHKLLSRLELTHYLTKEDLAFILENLDQAGEHALFDLALKTKQRYYGNRVYVRGLIEFSNVCSRNCLYCGLRAANTDLKRYRLEPEEIINCCREGYALGYRSFVLQSGEDPLYATARLRDAVKGIKQLFPEVAIALSVGEKSAEDYLELFEAGAERFLLRHETASKQLYRKLHPGKQVEERMACLKILKNIGYQVGAGFMVGLPGQTLEDIAEDLIYLKELDPEMVGIGPFIPHPATPLAREKGGTVKRTLVVLALARLLLPDCLIPATTALATLHPRGRELGLKAGANVVMPSLTPQHVKNYYELYQNKACLEETPEVCRNCLEQRINAIHFAADFSRGDNLRFQALKLGN